MDDLCSTLMYPSVRCGFKRVQLETVVSRSVGIEFLHADSSDSYCIAIEKEGGQMKTVEVPFVFNAKLKKDLTDDERICPVCHGTGLEIVDNEYGIKGDSSTIRFPYKHQSLSSCRNCYNGVVKVCEFCGEELNRSHYDCSCDAYVASERAKKETTEIRKGTKVIRGCLPIIPLESRKRT